MNQYPGNSYPSAPKNAYAAALQQPQRTGPIIVGASAVSASTVCASTASTAFGATTTMTVTAARPTTTASSTTGVSASAETAASSNSKNSANMAQPEGRYATASLAILASYAPPSVRNGKKRRADCINVLERLVPPLLLSSNNSTHDGCTGAGESGQFSKKKMENVETGEAEARYRSAYKNDDKSDGDGKIRYRDRLQRELEQGKRHNEFLVKRRDDVFGSMVALHELYETGLDGISRINDLRFVPDNVMPDKVPR